MDWEQTKENCVPVRQGRSKAALQEIADNTIDILEAKRRELWAEVTNYKGEDPLEAWQRYIKWMQEYGVGGGKADLQKVLEACTKDLQKHPRYTNDIRFLRIWIQYADCLPDPGDVFLFLKEKNIGRDFALYYEAYGTYYELKGNFQSADAVYMDGVQRGAKPLERLKQKHMAFQQRMAQRIQRKIQDEQVMGPPPPEAVRSSLATLGARSGGRSQQQQQQQSAMGSIFGAAAPQQQSGLLGGPRPGNQGLRPRPAVGIVEDEEFVDPENAPAGLPGYSTMPQVNNLRELKPYGVIRKENLDRPTAWNQAALVPGAAGPAAGGMGAGAGRSSSIAIFTDEEFQEEEDSGPAPIARRSEPGLPIPGLGGAAASAGPPAGHPLWPPIATGLGTAPATTGVDSLISGLAPLPSLLRGAQPADFQPAVPFAAAPSSSLHGPLPGAPSAAAAAAPREAVAAAPSRGGHSLPSVQAHADAGSVATQAVGSSARHADAADGEGPMGRQDDGVEEMSYDELRAAAWFRRNPAAAPRATASSARDNPVSVAQVAPSSMSLQSVAVSASAHMADTAATGCRGFTGVPYAESQAGAVTAVAGTTARRAPFGQHPPSDAPASQGLLRLPEQAPQGDNSIPTPRLDDGTATGGTKRRALAPRSDTASAGQSAALPQPEQLLQPSVAAAPLVPGGTAPQVPCNHSCKHDDAQPTVTISTRGAFDLLNSMFSEDLPHQQHKAQQQQEQHQQPTSRSRLMPPPPPRPPPLQPRAAAPVEQPWPAAHMQQPAVAAAAVPVAAAPPPVADDPTVTLHTREAFDALNDMFSDTLPHEAARKLMRRAADENNNTTSFKPISNADVRRLANAGRTSTAAAAPPPAAPFHSAASCAPYGGVSNLPAPAAAPSLAIHEDTFFLGPATAAASMAAGGGGLGNTGGCGFRGGPPQAAPMGPGIYEDTEFIPRGGGPARGGLGGGGPGAGGIGSSAVAGPVAASSGPFICEDTEFLTRPQGLHMASAAAAGAGDGGRGFAAPPGRGLAAGGAAPFGTPRAGGLPMGSRAVAAAASRGLGARPAAAAAAEPMRQSHGGSRGQLQVYEDTQYMGS
ncbi:hypothetical protein Agub_g5276 [Astrephomene gubernaculifera]|uniref:BUB1 N-terminal domain-containing protein n=1 Tax=Astrephomene gubernaculifera TaxID=47775 RepID=A0AAD3DLL9_9CHLO|nr:hypothetical protein Agub_g5276 [Astrephomene gubernaculifera]